MDRGWNLALRAQGESSLELAVYDVIGKDFWTGEGVTAKDIIGKLRAAPKATKIDLRINSVGGLVDEAKAMVNLLTERAVAGVEVVGWVDGIAASSAAYLLTAAKRVVMPSNAFQMVHGVSTGIRGTVEDVEAGAQLMRRINEQLAEAFAAASERRGKGKTKEDFLAAFAAGDLYLDADEAIEWGLADEKIEAVKLAACLADLSGLVNAPEAIRAAPYVVAAGTAPAVASPVVAPIQPIPPGPMARNNPVMGKEHNMSDTENKPNSYGSIIAALNLLPGASETDILGRLGRLREIEAQAMALTGVADSAQLIGGLRGMKERADAADKAQSELAQVKAERDKQRFEGLIAKGEADRRLTPAEAKHYVDRFAAATAEGRGAESVAELEGYLSVAPRKFAAPVVQPALRGTASTNPLTWNGKAYAELSPNEKHRLSNEEPELFGQMRAEHQQRVA